MGEFWSKKPWYMSYIDAKRRCVNKERVHYKSYGKKGIKFLLTKEEYDKLWFRDKAYNMKQPTIDREDNDGHYEYSNCRFIEMEENRKEEAIRRSISILQFDLNGNFIREWKSQREVRRVLKLNNLNSALKGRYKQTGGFVWKYKEN